MRRFCEVVCVKYCVFTFPLVVTTVQTHGGVQSALRSIHAPTRNEEGTYIRASIASDLDTLSTLSTPSHQGMMMNIFLWGGWVARPSAFCFCACAGSLSSVLAWSLCLLLSLCFVCSNWLPVAVLSMPSLFPAFSVDRVLPRLSVLILTALCRPCLFLVCIAFPPCLALILP